MDGLERAGGNKLRGFPLPRTSLIGRESELADIDERLGKSRLVTLTGVGGSGKTRLGIEAGKRAAGRFQDGAAFVDLPPLADPELIASTIAQALGLPSVDITGRDFGMSREDEVVTFLSQQVLLVVLDNCEHLIEECARLTDRILDECHGVTVLTTSREALGVHGESIFAVPPLELPDNHRIASESDAIRLFVERAGAVRAGLDLLGQHEGAVVEICRRLDGIPLAIELAAAQLMLFAPEDIAARLDDRFQLLSGGRRDQRHATLQAAIEWSYDLLSEVEQILLARLGVFVGGFSLEAVEGVCSHEGLIQSGQSELVASLVRKSLIVVTIDERGARYHLLETIRVFAIQRLVERGELDALRKHHCEWFTAWAESVDRDQLTMPAWRSVTDLYELERERDNLRAASGWAESESRHDLLARILVATDVLWWALGNTDEGSRWARTALSADLEPELRVRCLIMDAWLALWKQDPAAWEKSQSALQALEDAGLSNRPEAPGIYYIVGIFLPWVADYPSAHRLVAKGRAVAQSLGIEKAIHAADFYEGGLLLTDGRLDEACRVYDSFIEGVDLEDPAFLDAGGLADAAVAAHIAGRDDQILRIVQRLETLLEDQDQTWAEMFLRCGLAIARLSKGEYERALEDLLETLDWTDRLVMPQGLVYVLTLVAAALLLQGHEEDASRVLAAASIGGRSRIRTPGHFALRRHFGHLLHERLGDEATSRLRAEGALMSEHEAFDLARRIAEGGRVQRTRRTLTFVFTDIVDSTPLVELLGDEAWDDLMDWHDRTLRNLFTEHGGEEIDHAGDGFFVAFPVADAALDCARGIQRTLATHRRDHGFGPSLRIGIHTTEANERGGKYIGRGVHIAARVGAASRGGEILASRDTLETSSTTVPNEDPRTLELKGLTDPIEVATITW